MSGVEDSSLSGIRDVVFFVRPETKVEERWVRRQQRHRDRRGRKTWARLTQGQWSRVMRWSWVMCLESPTGRWHLHELCLMISGQRGWLWRAVPFDVRMGLVGAVRGRAK